MTRADEVVFSQAFNRLAVAMRLPATKHEDELKAQMRVYFDALCELPVEPVCAAAEGLQKRGSGFFPTTQEWFRAADDLAYAGLLDSERERTALLPSGDVSAFQKAKAARAKFLSELRAKGNRNGVDWGAFADTFERAIPCRDPERYPYASWCSSCDDSGWLSRVCQDGDRCPAHADVDAAWGEHEHVTRCGCRAMNPNIQRRLALARRA